MSRHFDIKSPQYSRESVPVSEVQKMPVETFIPKQCTPEKTRRWPYFFAGLVLFFLGAGVSITTLLFSEQTVAAPMIVLQSSTSTTPTTFTYGPQPRLSQPSFFAETLDSFKENEQSFIEADLSSMVIRYYEKGIVAFESPILSKGKEGSWWETPAGLYEVQLKKSNHLSSFGGVYQPWSMVFQGNFFIHGWPYYPDGTPVSSQYSGGCIRLADEDAKSIYDLAKVGIPILVYEKDYHSDGFSYDVPAPDIDAKAYLVADVQSNTILVEEGISTELPIASITKLMTALVAAEYINLDTDISIPTSAIVSTSVVRLKPGMVMSAYSLLPPLLLESSNTAANTYAQILGTSRFVALMNDKAEALGMADTTFTDASGADSGNVSTLRDLLRLSTYIFNNRSFVYQISSGKRVSTAYDVYSFGQLSNFNSTPGLDGFIGGKVGKTTAAKETTLALYEMNIRGESRTIAFVILGSSDHFVALQKLHAYMQEQYGGPAGSN